jgi:hypothetical protein
MATRLVSLFYCAQNSNEFRGRANVHSRVGDSIISQNVLIFGVDEIITRFPLAFSDPTKF